MQAIRDDVGTAAVVVDARDDAGPESLRVEQPRFDLESLLAGLRERFETLFARLEESLDLVRGEGGSLPTPVPPDALEVYVLNVNVSIEFSGLRLDSTA